MSKVLIVEDDTEFRESLYDLLKQGGHEVLTAGGSVQVPELLRTQRPQLILMDTTLPRISGLELAAQIRELDTSVPIMLLRESDGPEIIKEEVERLKPASILEKSSDISAMLPPIEAMLKNIKAKGSGQAGMKVPGFSGCILVVDDDPAARAMMKLIFQERGFKVIQAASGEEALKSLEQKPQAVLLDMTMPGMDGLMTLKKIKTSNPDLPVIMVSAHGEEELVREALKLGAHDYVTKPFSIGYLETTVMTKILVGMEG